MTKKTLWAMGLMLAPGLLAGCPIYVDSFETYGGSYGSPDVVVVGESVPGYIDVGRPTYTYGKGDRGTNPTIQSFTPNINQVQPGQPITFTVVAYDPKGLPLQFNWSSTGGTLSGNTGQVVSWDPPEKAGIYTITVTVANNAGGFVTGSLNMTVKATAAVPSAPPPLASPAPPATTPEPPNATPTSTPATQPTQTAQPTVAPTSAPTTAPAPTPTGSGTTTPTQIAPPAQDPEKAAIGGTVKDDAGPVVGAEMLLTSGDTKVVFESKQVTGADGKYHFANVPANVRLVLSARKTGYGEKLRTIQALKGTETVFDFEGTFALQRL